MNSSVFGCPEMASRSLMSTIFMGLLHKLQYTIIYIEWAEVVKGVADILAEKITRRVASLGPCLIPLRLSLERI
ncbi:hypothetical protein XFEB_01852 [Xylella fastidiosa EB92.1]|nr:hypothetical protein XFEB_01852 [Xylella fastidiosa EB92.1]